MPALKDRPDDIRVLVSDVLGRITERRQCEPYRVSPPALERLCNYDWPGNIRELENTLERATAFCVDQQIEPQDIEFMSLRRQGANSSASGVNLSGRTLAEIEKQAIVDTLEACDGNKAECARRLGISEKSIYNKMKRHELPL